MIHWSLVMRLTLAIVCVFGASAFAQDNLIQRLLERSDDLLRGDSSHAKMTMKVKTKRFERELTLESWSLGTEKSLIRIEAPARDKGTATLKIEDKIWNYLPKVDRTIRVPASMMSASWMGSHFTNDDLVRQSRFSEDFDCEAEENTELWMVDCVPHPDAPVVWGRVRLEFSKSTELPEKLEFFDEDNELRRTMLYDRVQMISGRQVPTRMRMVPADAPSEITEVSYEELEFDVEISDRFFSLQSLRR